MAPPSENPPGMPRLVCILGVLTLALLSGCAEDTITPVPSEGTETTEAGYPVFPARPGGG